MKEPVAFIGLGKMGKPMALNLLRAGFSLIVYNRSRPAMDELASAGAALASGPAEAASRAGRVITMLPDTPDVLQVILGPGGVIEGAGPGTIVADMSTILPAACQEMAEALAAKGIPFLDAPVSGGVQGAESASLSIMVGGPEDAFSRCLPLFQAMGKKIVHMGPSGSGATTKLCNQVVCVLNLLAAAEGILLGAKAGIDLEKLLDAVGAGAGASWMWANQGPRMIARDFSPGFTIRLQQKDLRLVLQTAERLGLPLPGTALVNQLFRAVEARGEGEKGTQALIQALEAMAGFEVSGGEKG
jgi:3-hydroxyisobutyrate dehydrogenase